METAENSGAFSYCLVQNHSWHLKAKVEKMFNGSEKQDMSIYFFSAVLWKKKKLEERLSC